MAKKLNVLQTIQSFTESGQDITVSSISRSAAVSREFIHSHRELHDAVNKAAKLQRAKENSSAPQGSGTNTQGLRADNAMLLNVLEKQRKRIAELEASEQDHQLQRQKWLGSQLASTNAIDPEVLSELHLTNERLMSDNEKLKRKVKELRQLVEVGVADLAASRQAHAEDVAQFQDESQRVVPIDRARATSTRGKTPHSRH